MAIAIPLLALAGTAIATYGAVKQGQAASQAADFQASQAKQNAVISTQQAGEDERAFRVFSRQQLGAISEGYGASGVSNEGSAQDVLESGAQQSELDALKIRYGGQLKAKGYQNTATLSEAESRSASAGGYLSAAGTLASGTAKAGYNFSGGAQQQVY